MRRLVAAVAGAAAVASGCAIRLDEPAATSGPTADLPVAEGCFPARDNAAIESIEGGLRSVQTPDGSILWLADTLLLAGGEQRSSAALLSSAPGALDDCLADATPTADPLLPAEGSPWQPDRQALDLVFTSGGATLFVAYYEPDPDAFLGWGLTGHGVAQATAGSAVTFESLPLPLWTADRFGYGSAAVVDGDQVFVFGCRPGDFLSADCSVARAPEDAAGDGAAYEYTVGGAHWERDIDRAFPLLEAGSSVSARYFEALGRYLMAYATPLGSEIVLRSGLSPAGPWSGPHPVALCELPEPDAFCGRVDLHPTLRAEPGRVVVSYSVGSFGAGPGEDPAAYSVRLASVSVESLP